MTTLENQSSDGSCSLIQPRHNPQHPHYDIALDDQPKDNLTYHCRCCSFCWM